MICAPALLAGAHGQASPTKDDRSRREVWALHQVVVGRTKIPILGSRQTRTETFGLARVTITPDGIDVKQVACRVAFKKVAGVQVRIPGSALTRLPAAQFRFTRRGTEHVAAPWAVGWSDQDVDGDGLPGMTVVVDAALCGGRLRVASQTVSSARGWAHRSGMSGKIRVEVKQRILGSSSLCLKLFARDSREVQTGRFVYRRVDPRATCRSLLRTEWPARVGQ